MSKKRPTKPKRGKRPFPGRPPTFSAGYMIHKVRLRLTKEQYHKLWAVAEEQGKSFRELLRQRLRKACPELEA